MIEVVDILRGIQIDNLVVRQKITNKVQLEIQDSFWEVRDVTGFIIARNIRKIGKS